MNTVHVARKLRLFSWALAAVTITVLLVWQLNPWDSARSPSDGGSTQAASNTDVGLTMYAHDERMPVPPLEGETLDGTRFSLDDLSGNVVVINVWGSWCGPCREETPDLVRVARENADRGVRFVGIDTRDNRAAAKAFVRTFKVPYPSIFDEKGRALLPFQRLIPSAAVPSTLVVDRDGNVAARIIGAVTYSTLSGIIDDLAESSR